MATDALDPGPNGDYPNLDHSLQPTGIRKHPTARDALGRPVLMDVEATLPDGRRVSELEQPADD